MSTTLDEGALRAVEDLLAPVDARLDRDYPGDDVSRQPVHTVYVPADRYGVGLARDWGEQARAALERAGGTEALLEAARVPADLRDAVAAQVASKLECEPVEDLRIDLEDGYGDHGDAEDDVAVAAGRTLRTELEQGVATPFVGIRFKSFERPTRRRGLRTLDLFLTTLLEGGDLPDGLLLTLPKVTAVEQVEAMVAVCDRIEQAHGLPAGRLGFEVQVETPQSILGPDGTALVARMVHAGEGRVTGLHYGTYDYSASLGISAAQQSMEHPAADHAKAVMQLAAAGTGVRLSDGSTNVLPVGEPEDVRSAWALHARLVRRSLERGYYQGWDLHPAQLPSRFAATYTFYREGTAAAAARLRAYLAREEGAVMDEPATARALAWFLQRGLDCGAVLGEELAAAGVDPSALGALLRPRADAEAGTPA
ncbi:citrate lyase beta subunit [Georgenia soli]|uniref:Citrate lyase beta subunit n=1 Tax=Georgenia soli TaxID=638953 RepID=A0A2A9EPA7_9MICO|nr:aldolase/citrate lyase family protein [Georgenia soli]PFG40784.1 citrate lyase beta subunit [Georgenia soli]